MFVGLIRTLHTERYPPSLECKDGRLATRLIKICLGHTDDKVNVLGPFLVQKVESHVHQG